MKNFSKYILFLIAVFSCCLKLHAQFYPVQLTPIFRSPYSIRLSDYANSMDTKMQLMANPTDISINNRPVRLKLSIQGNGLNIQTGDYVQKQKPVFINGGELQTLTNADIGFLFRLENLQGITAQQYANGLPEGMYSFCFEMYDLVTNQKISQKSCASLYLILNDPPLLNTPQKNEQIAQSDFPNIMFTWTPRQRNATNVSYRFELKQLMDPSLDPQIAFQMSPILHEETLFGTALLYNAAMPALMPGMRYAWRVKAISTTGLSENSVFKNDGYSEIYSFKYTQRCQAPTFALSEIASPSTVKISWQGTPDHTRYQVQYRKKAIQQTGKKGKTTEKTFEWFSAYSLNTQVLLANLEPETEYEFRVGSSCTSEAEGIQSFTYGNTNTFEIPKKESAIASYSCGIKPNVHIGNKTSLDNLIESETFTAGDFPVTVLELQGKNSPYSGRGYIVVPYLADAKIAVEFSNIVINTDYQLISGVVETSYNPDWKNVVDVEDFMGEGTGGHISETVKFEIESIAVNANGDILVNGKDGQQITIPGGKDTEITDAAGKIYHVDTKGGGSNEGIEPAIGGKPTPENTDGADKNGQATAFTAKGMSIKFSSAEKSKYAFDVMPENAPEALKKLYRKAGDAVLPYKAVLNGDSDVLQAALTVTDANVKTDSIVFKTQSGGRVDFKRNGNAFELTVKGNMTYAEEQILATVKQGDKWKIIGAFMLVHISPKEVNVALVPTDAVSENRLADVISGTQKIYGQVGVKINFTKQPILNIDAAVSGNAIQTEKNTIASTYSAEQQAINSLYQSADNSYVLFVTNKASSTGQQGYMRLNGQFGYVFNSQTALSKTPAHELGHGIFKLEHPFEQFKTAEKSTDFLMDYSSGTVLNHLDWKQINDPAFKLYAFQGQSSGEYQSHSKRDSVFPKNAPKYVPGTSFYDLDGNEIMLNSNFIPFAFVGENPIEHKGQLAVIQNVDTGKLFYPIDSKDGTEKVGYRGYDAYGNFSIPFQGFTSSKKGGTFIYVNDKCEFFENGKSLGIFEGCRNCIELRESKDTPEKGIFRINKKTFNLPDEYSVVASDKNEIDNIMVEIINNDRRKNRKDKQDTTWDINLVPSKDAEDVYKEVVVLWNNYGNQLYKEHLAVGINATHSITFAIEKAKLDEKKLLMPELIRDKTLVNVSEKFIQDFFANKIKGYENTVDGLKTVYDKGDAKDYELAGFNLVQHFYSKSGLPYYKTKTIADAIYKTKTGKKTIDNMIKLVDQAFQYKMSKPKENWNNNKFLNKSLDNAWFAKGIDVETFPSLGADVFKPTFDDLSDPFKDGTNEEKFGLLCIGGTQAAKVVVKDFKPVAEGFDIGYEATIIIQYLDTFGVSESDYTKDLPYKADIVNKFKFNYRGGILAQWILQHQYGYKTFEDYLTYIVKMKKTWKK